VSRPLSSLTIVDLPAPFSPSSACTCCLDREGGVVDGDGRTEGLANAIGLDGGEPR